MLMWNLRLQLTSLKVRETSSVQLACNLQQCTAGMQASHQSAPTIAAHQLQMPLLWRTSIAFVGPQCLCSIGAGYQPAHDQPCKIILSHHNFQSTPPDSEVQETVHKMFQAGADVAKVATTATDITDALRMLSLITSAQSKHAF